MSTSESIRVNQITEHGCFGCGELNEFGLKLQFFRVDDGVEGTFTPSVQHEGYLSVTHGGIVATVLDEAMSWAVIDTGRLAVTSRMTLEFRKPVLSGEEIFARARITRDRRRAVETEAELRDRHGNVLVAASALFIRVSDEQQRAWEATYINKEDRRAGGE